jgi:hypothetical protein
MDEETVEGLVEFSSTAIEDDRRHCPLCLRSTASIPQGQTLFKHIANHLETLATFSVPRNIDLVDENERGGSNEPVQADDNDEYSWNSDVFPQESDDAELTHTDGVKVFLDEIPNHAPGSIDVVNEYFMKMQPTEPPSENEEHNLNHMETEQIMEAVGTQVEYYFSVNNLIKDMFLRKHMDSQGFVFLDIIANFNRITQLTQDRDLVKAACMNSSVIEICTGEDGKERLRKREGWDHFTLPMEDREPSAQTLGPARLDRPQRPELSLPKFLNQSKSGKLEKIGLKSWNLAEYLQNSTTSLWT